MSGYARTELREQLKRGPQPDEDFFRLQVSGDGQTKTLNVSPDELARIIEAIDFDTTHVDTIRATLRETNPNEPSGEWSVWDLNQKTGIEWFDITEAIALLREETGGGRYVGGTAGHLYSLIPCERKNYFWQVGERFEIQKTKEQGVIESLIGSRPNINERYMARMDDGTERMVQPDELTIPDP